MCLHGSIGCEKVRNSSAIASITPATGVHKPMSKNNAAPAATSCRLISAGGGVVNNPAIPCWTGGIAATARKNASPVPGQPSGNVEKSRCTSGPVLRLTLFRTNRNPKKRIRQTPLSRGLEVDNSALQADGHSVRPIIGTQFGQNILDMPLHSFFRDGKLSGDLFVGVPARNEPQNLDFP
jgi:hypothetical protein